MVGPDILGYEGFTYQISAQKNNPTYVKQTYHPKLGSETLVSHDLEYAEIYEAEAA